MRDPGTYCRTFPTSASVIYLPFFFSRLMKMMGSPHNSLSFTLRWLLVPRTHSQTNQLQRAQQAATHTDTLSRFLSLSVTLCTRLKLPVVFLLMLFRGFGVWGRKSEALWEFEAIIYLLCLLGFLIFLCQQPSPFANAGLHRHFLPSSPSYTSFF